MTDRPVLPAPCAVSALATPPTRRRGLLRHAGALAAVSTLASLGSVASAQARRSGVPVRRMPVIFIGHGSPMNVLRDTPFTRRLAAWGRELPRPTAILSVSAHWLTRGTGVGVQAQPRTIHDFGGFPQALFDQQYPAPGHPALAREAAALVRQTRVVGTEAWGLDHGTWTVLKHLYPQADVPVFQLSIDYDQPAAFHHAVGRDLAALREQGVLILGSGNIAHNLRVLDRHHADGPSASRAWASDFDNAAWKALAIRDDAALLAYEKLPGAGTAVATPDHYYPLLYSVGAAAPNEAARTVFEGFQAGTISMRCLQFG